MIKNKKFLLDEFSAYKAMFFFLKMQYEQTNKNEELGDLLSDMGLTPDHYKTRDPAMWNEWIKSIEETKIKTEKGQN